jgi:hypothetical protein
MRKLIIALVVASASLVPGLASSQASAPAPASMSDLQADAPAEYTVQKGDTLWAISGRFLKEPWKWPQLWQMNREQVKNPHLIYPGDTIRLDRSGATPSLEIVSGASSATANVVRLEPRTHAQPLLGAVPTIPGNAIGPFLTEPLVLNPGELETHPQILATEEERVIIGVGDRAYVNGLNSTQGINWQIFRPGETLSDPVTGEVLGLEAVYIGDARVRRFGAPSTVEVTRAKREINRMDRLMPAREASFPSYVPRAPGKPINGVILSVRGGVNEISQYSIVAINRGSRDGVEVGHVLATMRRGETITHIDRRSFVDELFGQLETKLAEPVVLPSERSGLLFIFRTFEKLSYGLVLKSTRAIAVGDAVQTP